MSEVSSVVATLVARMETNPEDFEYEGKFYHIQDGLYALAGLRDDKAFAYWFLNDADRQALVAGWKQWHFKNFEKATYETLFDDGFEARKREQEQQMAQLQAAKQQMYQQQMAAQSQNSFPYITNVSNPAQGLTISANGAVNMANTLSVGGETIDSSILKKLKDLVK